MSSGRDHEKATLLLCIPFGLLLTLMSGIAHGAIGCISFAIGGLWISPDLDTHSLALKRWGILQWIWGPYRKIISHRSILSHGPFIGTALRLCYLLFWGSLIVLIINQIGGTSISPAALSLIYLIKLYPQAFLILIFSIEASAWLHLIQDGDP